MSGLLCLDRYWNAVRLCVIMLPVHHHLLPLLLAELRVLLDAFILGFSLLVATEEEEEDGLIRVRVRR